MGLKADGLHLHTPLELHLRRRLDRHALLTEVEELTLVEAERPGEQHRRELLDGSVELADGAVEEAARGGELVLDVGKLGLQAEEVLVRLQVGVGLGHREQLAKRAGQGWQGEVRLT